MAKKEITALAQALWCESNKTLYFLSSKEYYQAGDKYNGNVITSVWSGDQVTNTGTQPPGWSTVKAEATRVIFEPSFDDVSPRSLYQWFDGFEKLPTIDGIEYLNTSTCIMMSRMFSNCSSLTSIDVSRFDLSHVTHTIAMFLNCENLKVIYCDNVWFDVYTSTDMFTGCTSLKGAMGTVSYSPDNSNDIRYANPSTGYFTNTGTILAQAVWCDNNKTLYFTSPKAPVKVGETFNGETVTSVWSGGHVLATGDTAPGWSDVKGEAQKVVFDASFSQAKPTSLVSWFSDFTSLTTAIINNLNVSEAESAASMFSGCTSLTTIYCSNTWTIANTEGMFKDCTSLKGVVNYDAFHENGTMANPTTGYFTKNWVVILLNDGITASNQIPLTNETVTISGTGDSGEGIAAITVTGQRTGTDIAVTDNGDGTWSFTMPAENVTVKEEINIAIYDDADNSEVLRQYKGKTVNVTYDRTLSPNSQIVDGQIVQSPKAYTICLPYDLTLSDNSRIENGQIVQSLTVYNMAGVYSQPDNYVFTFAKTSPEMKAGMPYLVVVEEDTVSLDAKGVVINAVPSDGVPIYEIDDQDLLTDHLMGYWCGTFQKIESADAAAMFAYGLQSVGDFRRIRPDTPWAWFDSFRSLFCAAVPEGADPAVCPLPSNRYTLGLIRELGGDADEHGPLPFPVDSFEGDTDIPDDVVGIKEIEDGRLKIENSADAVYDLQGRRMESSIFNSQSSILKKGVYIHGGRKVVIK